MKAASFFKAYLWAEVLFCAYLLVKKPSENPSDAEKAIEDVKNRLKEKLDAPTENP